MTRIIRRRFANYTFSNGESLIRILFHHVLRNVDLARGRDCFASYTRAFYGLRILQRVKILRIVFPRVSRIANISPRFTNCEFSEAKNKRRGKTTTELVAAGKTAKYKTMVFQSFHVDISAWIFLFFSLYWPFFYWRRLFNLGGKYAI